MWIHLNEDDYGKFVLLTWGYSEGHSSVSHAVEIKDRRVEVIAFFQRNRDKMEEENKRRFVISLTSEKNEISSLLTELSSISQNSDQIQKVLTDENRKAELITKLRARDLDDEEKLILEALVQGNAAEIKLLNESVLQKQIESLEKEQERLDSLIEAQGSIAEIQEYHEIEKAEAEFTKLPGVVREVKVTNPVAGKPVIEIEIVDADNEKQETGIFSLIAQGIHTPKPLPLAGIALEQFATMIALQDSPLMPGEQTVGESVEKQGGIYRHISFSSRTGRHWGWGYLQIMPDETHS